ncbi:MAG: CDP-alcohol phosphatidyltransferase family protein [Candidatus Aminicenantes bacterium]|nr:MAG: CDP-alcohol phosphatidyltransferase family protein [Candidatus Aminicenantes bacterium]
MKCRPFKPKEPNCFYSEPNLLTLLRLVLSLTFFILAIIKQSPTHNFIGLGIHWLGDVLDGFYARKFKQETILGAEIDIIADRVEILFFYVNFLYFHPQLYFPVAVYLVDFAFIDFYLSYQFLKYDLISPIYFHKVDRTVYLLNFSSPGRFFNSTAVTLILIFLPQFQIIATIIAFALIGVKSYSIYLLNKKKLADKKMYLR